MPYIVNKDIFLFQNINIGIKKQLLFYILFYSRGCLVTPQTLICCTSTLEVGPGEHIPTVMSSIPFYYLLSFWPKMIMIRLVCSLRCLANFHWLFVEETTGHVDGWESPKSCSSQKPTHAPSLSSVVVWLLCTTTYNAWLVLTDTIVELSKKTFYKSKVWIISFCVCLFWNQTQKQMIQTYVPK